MRVEKRHAHVLQQLADSDPTLLMLTEGQELSPAFTSELVEQELDLQAADKVAQQDLGVTVPHGPDSEQIMTDAVNQTAMTSTAMKREPKLSKIEKALYNFFYNIAQQSPDASHSTDIPRSVWNFEADMLLASAEQ